MAQNPFGNPFGGVDSPFGAKNSPLGSGAISREKKLAAIEKGNKASIAKLNAAGIDTSEVTKKKENPLFALLGEWEQATGFAGGTEWTARMAEQATGGKPISDANAAGTDVLGFLTGKKGSEREELTLAGAIPTVGVNAALAASLLSGGTLAAPAAVVAAASLMPSLMMYLRDKTVGNKYVAHDDVRQLMGTDEPTKEDPKMSWSHAILNYADKNMGTNNIAHDKVINFGFGMLGALALDPNKFSFGTSLLTKGKILTQIERIAINGLHMDDLLSIGMKADDLINYGVDPAFVKIIQDMADVKVFGLNAAEVAEKAIPEGIPIGVLREADPALMNKIYLGIRHKVMDEAGDLGGIKMMGHNGKTLLDVQKVYDKAQQSAFWKMATSNDLTDMLAKLTGFKPSAAKIDDILAARKVEDTLGRVGGVKGTQLTKGPTEMNETSKLMMRIFGAGRMGELKANAVNDFELSMVDVLKQRQSAQGTLSANLSQSVARELQDLLKDPKHRQVAGLTYSLVYGPSTSAKMRELTGKDGLLTKARAAFERMTILESRLPVSMLTGEAIKSHKLSWLSALTRTVEKDPDKLDELFIAARQARQEYSQYSKAADAIKRELFEEFGYKYVAEVIQRTGKYSDEEVANIIRAQELFRKRMMEALDREIASGHTVSDLFGLSDDLGTRSLGYAPGYLPINQKKYDEDAFAAVMDDFADEFGIDLETLDGLKQAHSRKVNFKYANKTQKDHSKQYLTLIDRIKGGEDEAGFATELDIAKLAGQRTLKSHSLTSLQDLKAAVYSAMGRPLGLKIEKDAAVPKKDVADLIKRAGEDASTATRMVDQRNRFTFFIDQIVSATPEAQVRLARQLTREIETMDPEDAADIARFLDSLAMKDPTLHENAGFALVSVVSTFRANLKGLADELMPDEKFALLRQEINSIPGAPGVYQWTAGGGPNKVVLYVGMSGNLKNRVGNYVRVASKDVIPDGVRTVSDFISIELARIKTVLVDAIPGISDEAIEAITKAGAKTDGLTEDLLRIKNEMDAVDAEILDAIMPVLTQSKNSAFRKKLYAVLGWDKKRIPDISRVRRYPSKPGEAFRSVDELVEAARPVKFATDIERRVGQVQAQLTDDQIREIAIAVSSDSGAEVGGVYQMFHLIDSVIGVKNKAAVANSIQGALVNAGVDPGTWQFRVISAFLDQVKKVSGAKVYKNEQADEFLKRALDAARANLDPDEFNRLVLSFTKAGGGSDAAMKKLADLLGSKIDDAYEFSDASGHMRWLRDSQRDNLLKWEHRATPRQVDGVVSESVSGSGVIPGYGEVSAKWVISKNPDGYDVYYITKNSKGKVLAERRVTEIPADTLAEAEELSQRLQRIAYKYDTQAPHLPADSVFKAYDDYGDAIFDVNYKSVAEQYAAKRQAVRSVATGNPSMPTVGSMEDKVFDLTRAERDGIVTTKQNKKLEDEFEKLSDLAHPGAVGVDSNELSAALFAARNRFAVYDLMTEKILSRDYNKPYKSMEEFILDVIEDPRADRLQITEEVLRGADGFVPMTHRVLPSSRSSYADALYSKRVRASADKIPTMTSLRDSVREMAMKDSRISEASDRGVLLDHVERWIALQDKGSGKSTALRGYVSWLFDTKFPDKDIMGKDIHAMFNNSEVLKEYAVYLLDSGKTPGTIKGYLGDIKDYLLFEKIPANNKLSSVSSYIVKEAKRRVSEAPEETWQTAKVLGTSEVNKFIDPANYDLTKYEDFRDMLAARILYTTGVRETEFAQQTWDELMKMDFTAVGKGGTKLIVGYDSDTMKLLKQFKEQFGETTEFPFMSKNANGEWRRWVIDENTASKNNILNQALQARAKTLGTYEGVTSHMFRHSAATHMVESGISVEDVSAFLHHAKLETTVKYYLHPRAMNPAQSRRMQTGKSDLVSAYRQMVSRGRISPQDSTEKTMLDYMLSDVKGAFADPEVAGYGRRYDPSMLVGKLKKQLQRAEKNEHRTGVFKALAPDGTPLYVASADDMAARVGRLVNQDERAMVPELMAEVDGFEFVPTATRDEALALEAELIKQYQPRYNYGTVDYERVPSSRLLRDSKPPSARVSSDAVNDSGHQWQTQAVIDEMNEKNLYRDMPDVDPRTVPVRDNEVTVSVKIGKDTFMYAVPAEVEKFFSTFMTEQFTDDNAVKRFLQLFDTGMSLWKRQATVLRLGFHTRNKLSNAFLMWINGMFDPEAWAKSVAVLRGGEETFDFKGNKHLIKEFGTDKLTYSQVLQLAEANRVRVGFLEASQVSGRQIGTEIFGDNLLETVRLGKGYNPLSGESKYSMGMQYMGTNWVEDADRTATFMSALRQGLRPSEAGYVVDRVLYPYDTMSLSLFESAILKRIFPFYSWMKNNTPAMMRLLMENPQTFLSLRRASEGSFDVQGADRQVMPDFLMKSEPVFMLPMKDKVGNNYVANAGIPIADITKPFSVNDMLSSMNPLIKSSIEYPTNYDLFYDKPIEATPGQKKRMPTYWYPIDKILGNPVTGGGWDTIKSMLGIVEQTDAATGETYLAGPAKSIKFIKDISPLLNSVSKAGRDPLESTDQSVADIIAEITGLKFTPYDEETLKGYNTYEQFGKLQELTGAAKANQLIPTTEPKKPKKPKTLEEVLRSANGK